jgi:quercetin dioxygenase-like cupin family protein
MTDQTAHLVDLRSLEAIDVLGPTIQYVTPPEGPDSAPCIMRGTIPPGGAVPLHSHADPETFIVISGDVEGLVVAPEGPGWIRIGPRDVFHVPGGVKHAWRNPSGEPAVMFIVSTAGIGRFFLEVGGPDATLERFVLTAQRYGHWMGTPEENQEVGLDLSQGG